MYFTENISESYEGICFIAFTLYIRRRRTSICSATCWLNTHEYQWRPTFWSLLQTCEHLPRYNITRATRINAVVESTGSHVFSGHSRMLLCESGSSGQRNVGWFLRKNRRSCSGLERLQPVTCAAHLRTSPSNINTSAQVLRIWTIHCVNPNTRAKYHYFIIY